MTAQPRENPVPCRVCLHRKTWNPDALCNDCYFERREEIDRAIELAEHFGGAA